MSTQLSKNSGTHFLSLQCIRDKQGIISEHNILATNASLAAETHL